MSSLTRQIRKSFTDLRAVVAYELLWLAAWIYRPLMGELVEMALLGIVTQGEDQS